MSETLAPLEIKALTKIVDELSYYQLLHVEPKASAREIKQAYYASSRCFHPDANRHLQGELADDVALIAKRITEAYCVLRDAGRREAYDEMLNAAPDNRRIQLSEARAAHQKSTEDREFGATPQGRQFFQKASTALARGEFASAVSDLQMALTFEPGNATFKQKLEEAKAARDAN